MSSNAIYVKEFKEIVYVEDQIRDIYKFYIKRIKDPFLLKKLRWIYKQEEEHAKIAQGFINMVSQ